MFTGLVSDVGEVIEVSDLPKGRRLRVSTSYDTASIELGASICNAGVCLTVVSTGEGWFEVEAWEEALRLTTLGSAGVGTRLNLEKSLRMGDELGGHLVSGHVDGMVRILTRKDEGDAVRFTLEAPQHLMKFVAEKGSVALDGTSLTVNHVTPKTFDVLLIRHSLSVTTWGERSEGDSVNLEVDQIARYTARLIEMGQGQN